jgi:hypothetical protein
LRKDLGPEILTGAVGISTTQPYKISIYNVRFAFTSQPRKQSDQWMEFKQVIEKVYTYGEYEGAR